MHKTRSRSAAEMEALRRFIAECVKNVDQIEQTEVDLNDAQRKSLMDISVWANELGRQIRRSPRKAVSIAVRLRGESPNGPWEEETKTVLLSRHGASLVCQHPVKPGDIVQFEQIETGNGVQARVVWNTPAGEEGVRLGLEFVGRDDFWGLNWSETANA